MNINNLKPAWRQLKLLHSLDAMDQKEIIQLIEPREGLVTGRAYKVFSNYALFLFLMLCCQGG